MEFPSIFLTMKLVKLGIRRAAFTLNTGGNIDEGFSALWDDISRQHSVSAIILLTMRGRH